MRVKIIDPTHPHYNKCGELKATPPFTITLKYSGVTMVTVEFEDRSGVHGCFVTPDQIEYEPKEKIRT